jgi:ribosomal protein L12E/L44/L45/RPP1/RPP2
MLVGNGSQGNRAKLQKLYALLWKLVGVTLHETGKTLARAAAAEPPQPAAETKTKKKKKGEKKKRPAAESEEVDGAAASSESAQRQLAALECRAMLDMLCKHIFEMTSSMPEFAGVVALKHLRALADGESFMRVHWIAVPKALRARRVNRALPGDRRRQVRRGGGGGGGGGGGS